MPPEPYFHENGHCARLFEVVGNDQGWLERYLFSTSRWLFLGLASFEMLLLSEVFFNVGRPETCAHNVSWSLSQGGMFDRWHRSDLAVIPALRP